MVTFNLIMNSSLTQAYYAHTLSLSVSFNYDISIYARQAMMTKLFYSAASSSEHAEHEGADSHKFSDAHNKKIFMLR